MPARHWSQRPQAQLIQAIPTRSPCANRDAHAPACSTLPTIWWPGTTGRRAGRRPSISSSSVWHTPQAETLHEDLAVARARDGPIDEHQTPVFNRTDRVQDQGLHLPPFRARGIDRATPVEPLRASRPRASQCLPVAPPLSIRNRIDWNGASFSVLPAAPTAAPPASARETRKTPVAPLRRTAVAG